MYDTEGLISVLTINAIITPVLLIVAYVVQHKERIGKALMWKVFRPRRPDAPPTFFSFSGADGKATVFGALLRGRDLWAGKVQGFEAQLYLQFLRLIMLMFATVSLLLLAVLVPINVSSDYRESFIAEERAKDPDSSLEYEEGIADWSTRNIAPKSNKLWAIFVMSLVVAFEMYGMAFNMMNTLLRAKAKQAPPTSAIVKLTHVTASGKASSDNITEGDVLKVIPTDCRGAVTHVEIPRKVPEKMLDTIAKHDEALKNTEHWYAFCEKNGIEGDERFSHEKVVVKDKCCGSKVNAIEHFRAQVDKYHERLVEMKAEIDASGDTAPTLGVAYVTFDSAAPCARFVSEADKNAMFGRPVWFAPHPKCVVWNNLGASEVQLRLRFAVTCAALSFLALIWGSIIAFLGSADKLGEFIPAFEVLLDTNEELRGAVTAYLPVIALAVLNALLPKILRAWTEKFELAPDRSVRELGVLRKYFVFSLLTSILLQAAAQGVGDSTDILEDMDMTAFLMMLSSMIIPTNGFFVAVVVQTAFMGNMTRLLCIGDMVLGPIMSSFALTQRELDAAYEKPQFYFSEHYANALVIFAFAMLFSTNVPYIPVWGFFFFLLRYLVDRSALCDIFPSSRASDLRLVPTAVMSALVVLFLMQLFGVAFLTSIKEKWDVFGISLMSLAVTGAFMFVVNRKAGYALGPQFIIDGLNGKVDPVSEFPSVTSVIGQIADGRPVGQAYTLDFSAWAESNAAPEAEKSGSLYQHPAKAYRPVKTDHAEMAARSFYVEQKEEDPLPSRRICASDSVFFSHPSTPKEGSSIAFDHPLEAKDDAVV
ncbi:Calcium permeable stress-gated cation channel 1 [Diplonema papillatum]|nr:Calcium permeable stress-gated cation channel 1 [Diplonema papillatum]